MWFQQLMGFKEESSQQVRENITLEARKLTSKVNGKSFVYGTLETPTLQELRERTKHLTYENSSLQIAEIVGDVQAMHTDITNKNALFQVASQFNLLEMVNSKVTPEEGIGIYSYDRTQGPACAIAAGAGTIFRNYYVPLNGQIGQTADHQIDGLKDIGEALGNTNDALWKMQNGYVMPTYDGLLAIIGKLVAMTEKEIDELRGKLRIGIHWHTQVTLNDCQHLVTQTYNSALPVAYNTFEAEMWAAFAQLVLDASYEATFHTALLNYEKTGNNQLYLTLLGGGAFGNQTDWIFNAIRKSIKRFEHTPLDVKIVSYRYSNPDLRHFIEGL